VTRVVVAYPRPVLPGWVRWTAGRLRRALAQAYGQGLAASRGRGRPAGPLGAGE